MNSLERSLRRCIHDLEEIGVPFALVGGLAVSARAEPRLTRDADLAIAAHDDLEAEAVIARLRSRGYEVRALVEQEAVGRLATARLVHADSGALVTDLLFASSGIESEVVSGAEVLRVLPDLVLPVASVGHLIAMKLLARDDRNRPADADDLASLMSVANVDDWATAERAIGQIIERGYARGRDLRRSLADLRTRGAYGTDPT